MVISRMMQNNKIDSYIHDNEMGLQEIFKLLINSKKLIISITLFFTLLGAIYHFQKPPVYYATGLIEIGNYEYDLFEDININDRDKYIGTVEKPPKLIQNLNIEFLHKSDKYKSALFKSIEDKLIEVEISSPSLEIATISIDEITQYIINRHSEIHSLNYANLKNKLTFQIKNLNDRIDYISNKSNDTNELAKLEILNALSNINNDIPYIDLKIQALKTIINAENENLTLLKSEPKLYINRASVSPTLDEVIFNYHSKLIDFENEKKRLLLEKKYLNSEFDNLNKNNLESEEIFTLLQEKYFLDLKLKRLDNNNNFTNSKLIDEIKTEVIQGNLLIVLLSFIFGLSLSFFTIFINNYLSTLNEGQA